MSNFTRIFAITSFWIIVSCDATGLNHTRPWLQFPRKTRQIAENCGFQCKNSECIDEDKYCDGALDCADGSDETNACKNLGCPDYLFRCDYGACISRTRRCDGNIDCSDGSDEKSQLCGAGNGGNMRKNCENVNTQFGCVNGSKCIDIDRKCDGKADCEDSSDETSVLCSTLSCPGYTFKCKYGACISKLNVCNGFNDCVDGSDEDVKICSNVPRVTTTSTTTRRPTVPPLNTDCPLTQIENGNLMILGGDNTQILPNFVKSGTIVLITCREGYKNIGGGIPICLNGKWNPSLKCERVCRDLIVSSGTKVTCTVDDSKIDCGNAVTGTLAKFSCDTFFELNTKYDSVDCHEGKWSQNEPQCRPVCGQKRVKIKENVIGGGEVEHGNYPWSIALYKLEGDGNYDLICGGTLVNQKKIITAAHCVSNRKGEPYQPNLFRVAAGKFHRNYTDPRDVDAEFSSIEKIIVHRNYKGSRERYGFDIAVLVIQKAFSTTNFIQRICVDFKGILQENTLYRSSGVVTGWGFTVSGKNASEVLREIELPLIEYKQCDMSVDEDYKEFITSDKLCVGYRNEGKGVCQGDSGGGLAVLNENAEKDYYNRYFLVGIVSVSPQKSGSCDEDQYSFFTKVSEHRDFLRNHVDY